MKQPKYCKECKWSKPEESSEWSLRCHNPVVNGSDSWSLASPKVSGTSAREERELKWYSFPACGMVGKLWEKKNTLECVTIS